MTYTPPHGEVYSFQIRLDDAFANRIARSESGRTILRTIEYQREQGTLPSPEMDFWTPSKLRETWDALEEYQRGIHENTLSYRKIGTPEDMINPLIQLIKK